MKGMMIMKMNNEMLVNEMNDKGKIRYILYHFRLGLQQTITNPLFLAGVIIVWATFAVLYARMAEMPYIKDYARRLAIIGFVVISMFFVGIVGEAIGRSYEGKLMLAFKPADLRSVPVLIYRKWHRQQRVWVLQFYSLIPDDVWEERRKQIEYELDVHIRGRGIKCEKNIITLYVVKGRNTKERGILYDEEL